MSLEIEVKSGTSQKLTNDERVHRNCWLLKEDYPLSKIKLSLCPMCPSVWNEQKKINEDPENIFPQGDLWNSWWVHSLSVNTGGKECKCRCCLAAHKKTGGKPTWIPWGRCCYWRALPFEQVKTIEVQILEQVPWYYNIGANVWTSLCQARARKTLVQNFRRLHLTLKGRWVGNSSDPWVRMWKF